MINYNGAYDNQTEEQKAKNYKFEEVCLASFPALWVEKDKDKWKQLPTVRNQDGSGSCVCQTDATEDAIIFLEKYGVWVDFSGSKRYQRRGNKDISGCTSTDVFKIFPEESNVFEKDMPSQNMSDEQIMAVKCEPYFDDLGSIFKSNRIQLPIDFETIASTIQATGKGIMLWFHFHPDEWIDIPYISDKIPTSGHSVTAIDFFLYKGKKYLLIVDSWGKNFAIKGYRLISEEYFKERCFLAAYKMKFKVQDNNTEVERPHFDGSIISFQKCMRWEGLFPANVPLIESFGPISRKACKEFQLRYNIEPALGNLGPITREKLLEFYK